MRIKLLSSRPIANFHCLLCDELGAQGIRGCVVLVDYFLGFRLEGLDISGTCVVHVILAYVEHGLKAIVAPSIALLRGQEFSQLVVYRVGYTVEDAVQDRLGPQRETPALDLLVGHISGRLSGAERAPRSRSPPGESSSLRRRRTWPGCWSEPSRR